MSHRTIASLLLAGLLALGAPLVASAAEEAGVDPTGAAAVVETASAVPEDDGGQEAEAATAADDAASVDAPEMDESDLVSQLEGDLLAPQADGTAAQTTAEAQLDAYAAAHEGDLADGTYAITSCLPGNLALDVYGNSMDPGANVIIWFKQETDNQRWIVKGVGGGYVTITSASSGKVLDVSGGDPIPAADVIQWVDKANGSRNQRWVISKEADGSYKITSAMVTADGSRLVLDVRGAVAQAMTGTCVFVEKQGSAPNQRWTIEEPLDVAFDAEARAHEDDLADGTYFVASQLGSSLVLDVSGASCDPAAKVVVWPQIPAANEAWQVTHDNDGYVVFTNLYSGQVLDVYGGAANAGAEVIQWPEHPNGARNQRWIVSKEADGSYKITSAMTGMRLVLDVSGASAKPAAQTVVWLDKTGSAANQRWTFTEVPEYFDYLDLVEPGTYAIKSAFNNKVLDVYAASTEQGAPVKLWVKKSEDNANQVWYVSQDSRVCTHFESMHSTCQLALRQGSVVQVRDLYDWIVVPAGRGRFYLSDANSGKVLTVESDGTTVSAAVQTGATNQLWSFEETEVAYSTAVATGDTRIMGSTPTSSDQAVRYLKAFYARNGYSLPSYWRSRGESIESIVGYFWEEAAAEGVRADVALAQSLHETAYFQFGGDVIPEQFNFAGLGTTGGGVKGNYFESARIGVRAQIQHLKAYASTAPLNRPCVDQRFNLVSRGCAPTLSGLSGRWAVPGYSIENGRRVYYHEMLADIMNRIAAY